MAGVFKQAGRPAPSFFASEARGALLASFGVASLQWLCRYGVLPLLVLAFAPARNPLPLLAVQGFIFSFSLLLVAPGGGGGVEVITALVLQHFVPVSAVGVVLLLWRFYTFHLYLLGGGVAFFFTCSRLARLFPKGEESGAGAGVETA